MKKLFTLFVIIALTIGVLAQSPQKMSYQAVIRNTTGGLVMNHAVGMRISILRGSPTGTVVYSETYTPVPQTNANGLVSIEIGTGIPVTGTFSGIDWSAGTYYMKTEADPAGGTSYTIIGTSQLLSVPYALNSKISESVADNSVTSAKIVDGTLANSDLGNNSVTSAKIADATIASADLAANSVTPEKINAGAVTGAKIAQAGATAGQALKWNSTTWAPADDLTGGGSLTLPYSGSISSDGFAFSITNSVSSAIIGKSTNSTGSSVGVYGESSSDQNAYGVYGKVAGAGIGVYGEGRQGGASGVYGKIVADGYGVYGLGESGIASNRGVYGQSNSAYGGIGVEGNAASTTGETIGVKGHAISNSGYGIYGSSPQYGVCGMATHTSAINYGGYFTSLSSSGYGVYGDSPKFGVYGKSSSSTGRAVMGEAMGTGSIGVYGKALADNSTGVWGEGAKYDFLANGPGIDYGTGSSIRWKNNIIPIPDPLGKIAAIRGVFFDWDEMHGGKRDVGMIAEEVGKVLPEIVAYEGNGVDAYGMDYSKITPLLIEAIKEQQVQIDELKALVNTLIANQTGQDDN